MIRRPSRHVVEAVCVVLVAGLMVSVAVAAVLHRPAARFPLTVAAPAQPPSYDVEAGRPPATVREPELLVSSPRTLSAEAVRAVRRLPGVDHVERVGIGSVTVTGRAVLAVAADPSSYRRLAPARTAGAQDVWAAVARGELAATHDLGAALGLALGSPLPVGRDTVRLGALATTVPGIDVVVNRLRGRQLGIPGRNGLVVSLAAGSDASSTATVAERTLAPDVVVSTLEEPTPARPATGVGRLVGGSVSQAVGGFGYRWFADGTVDPDPAWVSASIVTAPVPLLGDVTCHRVMLPQLRGALQEVVEAGLADSIDAGDYGGCYVPRFIDRDPRRGLSLHTWGIAVDLNVATNQLGTAGLIDRRVVEIFARWGFSWGGHWRRPDPMHFELAVLRTPG